MEKRRRAYHSTHWPKARATDVLGRILPQPGINAQWRKFYDRLVDLRNYLLQHRGDLARDASEETPAYSMHMADAGTDNYDRDFVFSMISSEQNTLYEIDEALNRIRDGTYGVCELTGQRIEAERLEAIPWTRFSAQAEKQLEKEGAVGLARLGRREELPKGPPPGKEEEEEEEGEMR